MIVIAVVNQKGGCGKSPTSFELAAALAALKHRVVIIDMDPQGTLSGSIIGPGPQLQAPGTAELLLGQATFEAVAQATPIDNLRIVVANHDRLEGAGTQLEARGVDGFLALVEALDGHEKLEGFIVIDCPSNTKSLTNNALAAADYALVPIDSTQARVAMSHLKRAIKGAQRLNPDLVVLGAVLTKFVTKRKLSADRLQAVSEDEFFPQAWPTRLSDGFERSYRAGLPLRTIAASPSEHAAVAEIDVIAKAVVAAAREKKKTVVVA